MSRSDIFVCFVLPGACLVPRALWERGSELD